MRDGCCAANYCMSPHTCHCKHIPFASGQMIDASVVEVSGGPPILIRAGCRGTRIIPFSSQAGSVPVWVRCICVPPCTTYGLENCCGSMWQLRLAVLPSVFAGGHNSPAFLS